MTTTDRPLTVICRYRVKPGQEARMRELLTRHWPRLHQLGLVTDEPPRYLRGLPSHGKDPASRVDANTFVEIFSWKNAKAPQTAHLNPEVMAIWEPMGSCCESMEFPEFEALEIEHA